MDLAMPLMDGAEAFGELRRLNPDVPVVLASGYVEDDVSSRFEGKMPSGILRKPYTLAKLRETLAGLLPTRPAGEA
jgi:CheY-like chemotaxis protein